MKITDPKPFLDAIDQTRLQEALGNRPTTAAPQKSPIYIEPGQNRLSNPDVTPAVNGFAKVNGIPQKNGVLHSDEDLKPNGTIAPVESSTIDASSSTPPPSDIRKGKIQRLGDFIDTDAVSPSTPLYFPHPPTNLSLPACPRRNPHQLLHE